MRRCKKYGVRHMKRCIEKRNKYHGTKDTIKNGESLNPLQLFFCDEGGYSTITLTCALLLSVVLMLSVALAGWSHAKSADIQNVADVAALAGSNVVSAYTTIAAVLDACVLSLGILGISVLAAGLVCAAIPVLQMASSPMVEGGKKILSVRKDFAKSCYQGMQKLENALPVLILANAAAVTHANSTTSTSYAGAALCYPQKSQSDFGLYNELLDTSALETKTHDVAQVSQELEDAANEARAAKERAFRADCVDDPRCLQSRAKDLAGLSSVQNPVYTSPEAWKFLYAKHRALNYYAQRTYDSCPPDPTPDELQRYYARDRFYHYAYQTIRQAPCEEGSATRIELPELAHGVEAVKKTILYTERVWPIYQQNGENVLHCAGSCPGIEGKQMSLGSLADIDKGNSKMCPVCKMDVRAMARVAAASTNINNGFEYYWQIIVEESRKYQTAKDKVAELEKNLEDKAHKAALSFDEVLAHFGTKRPKLCPPGAFGCIALVVRAHRVEPPATLLQNYIKRKTLPSGAAIAGSCLAPTEDDSAHNVLGELAHSLASAFPSTLGIAEGVADLWGKLLVGYGAGYRKVEQASSDFLETLDEVAGERIASWLRDKVRTSIEAIGLEPADMRCKKPVLVHTQDILDKSGKTQVGEIRDIIVQMPTDADEARAWALNKTEEILGSQEVTIAELKFRDPVPFSIPLTLNLGELFRALTTGVGL